MHYSYEPFVIDLVKIVPEEAAPLLRVRRFIAECNGLRRLLFRTTPLLRALELNRLSMGFSPFKGFGFGLAIANIDLMIHLFCLDVIGCLRNSSF